MLFPPNSYLSFQQGVDCEPFPACFVCFHFFVLNSSALFNRHFTLKKKKGDYSSDYFFRPRDLTELQEQSQSNDRLINFQLGGHGLSSGLETTKAIL